MDYLTVGIIRPLYGQSKKIASSAFKIGDRFVIEGDENLWFKLDIIPNNNQYLCANEMGTTRLLVGDTKVERINGISFSFNFHSKEIVKHFLENQ